MKPHRITTHRPGPGGLESRLDFAATAIRFAGAFLALTGLAGSFATSAAASDFTIFAVGTAAVASTLFSAYVVSMVFKFFAESLRLQKSLAGLPFHGQISSPTTHTIQRCSECNMVIHEVNSTACDVCGAHFGS